MPVTPFIGLASRAPDTLALHDTTCGCGAFVVHEAHEVVDVFACRAPTVHHYSLRRAGRTHHMSVSAFVKPRAMAMAYGCTGSAEVPRTRLRTAQKLSIKIVGRARDRRGHERRQHGAGAQPCAARAMQSGGRWRERQPRTVPTSARMRETFCRFCARLYEL